MRHSIALLIIASLCGACTAAAPREGAYAVTRALAIDMSPEWGVVNNRLAIGIPSRRLSVDGAGLNSIDIVAGLLPGDILPIGPDRYGAPESHFEKEASDETSALVVRALEAGGCADIELSNLAPREVGKAPGRSFDLSYTTGPGLRIKGNGVYAIHEEKFYLALYTAPALHYYDLHRESASAILASARLGEE